MTGRWSDVPESGYRTSELTETNKSRSRKRPKHDNSGVATTKQKHSLETGRRTCGSKDTCLQPHLSIHRPLLNQGTLTTFFKLLDDDVIQDMLWYDRDYRLADKYLIAMVYVYFKRANLLAAEYTQRNFFVAMYLAADMEEDDDDWKMDLIRWSLGNPWRNQYRDFLQDRDALWESMHYRAAVSCTTCHEVMSFAPNHPAWQRSRRTVCGGAIRNYAKTKSKATFSRPDGVCSPSQRREE